MNIRGLGKDRAWGMGRAQAWDDRAEPRMVGWGNDPCAGLSCPDLDPCLLAL